MAVFHAKSRIGQYILRPSRQKEVGGQLITEPELVLTFDSAHFVRDTVTKKLIPGPEIVDTQNLSDANERALLEMFPSKKSAGRALADYLESSEGAPLRRKLEPGLPKVTHQLEIPDDELEAYVEFKKQRGEDLASVKVTPTAFSRKSGQGASGTIARAKANASVPPPAKAYSPDSPSDKDGDE